VSHRSSPASDAQARRNSFRGAIAIVLGSGRRFVGAALLLPIAGGCTGNPYLTAPGTAPWQTPGAAIADPSTSQISELNRRVRLLDDNNRQLHTQLAQSEQQAQVYRDELNLVRQQLADTANKLDSAMLAANDATQKFQGLQASTTVRGGATLRANTNLQQLAGQLAAVGLNVVPDGETLRIILPADQLFQPGSASLEATSAALIDTVATQVRSLLPRQRIAIEGYTDNAPLYGGRFSSNHQLAAAQATSVLEMLTRRSGLPEAQFFTIAQGTNHPRADNGSPQGRAANRRIELVVYPDTF
jgi:flagellar motor protein MotB